MVKIKEVGLAIADNGGYTVHCSMKTRMGEGPYEDWHHERSEEAFGPTEGKKAYARLEELKKVMLNTKEEHSGSHNSHNPGPKASY